MVHLNRCCRGGAVPTPLFSPHFLQKNCVHNVGIHSTGILLEKMGAKQGCWNSTSTTTPIKVYRNAPFLTVQARGLRIVCAAEKSLEVPTKRFLLVCMGDQGNEIP